MKHKTQVFIDPEEDHYRTRLTHTLEVSQIARTVARALSLNEDLTEAIALGHDLGHTPFGHSGERALNDVYQEYIPGAAFHHNEQSLRVVDFLERDGVGLNLTSEVREGILNHSKGSGDLTLDKSCSGMSLEAQIVRVADRIAYINHDIDDAVRANVISESDIPEACTQILGCRFSERISTMVVDLVEQSWDEPLLRMSPEVLIAMNDLKNFLFKRVYRSDASGPRMDELRKAGNLLKELFRFHMSHTDLLPEWLIPKNNSTEEAARAVCDYIAGMTDRYAQRQYAELFIPEAWGGY